MPTHFQLQTHAKPCFAVDVATLRPSRAIGHSIYLKMTEVSSSVQPKKKRCKILPDVAQTRDSWYRRSAFPVSVVVQTMGGRYSLFEKVVVVVVVE